MAIVITATIYHGIAQPAFYGMTLSGGTDGVGVIFKIAPDGSAYEVDYEFQTPTPGLFPDAEMMKASNGKLYGVTWRGGAFDDGVLFEYDVANDNYSLKKNFNEAEGATPVSRLMEYGGKLYGTTHTGGEFAFGVLYSYDLATGEYARLKDFMGTDGKPEKGGLIEFNGKLYGTTTYGGDADGGVIFEFNPQTNDYAVLHHFDINNGGAPLGVLTAFNGKFYGVTMYGGINGDGSLFEFDPATNTYAVKIFFDGNNGSNPQGSLTEFNGKLYGLTSGGGLSHFGVLFEYAPLTNTLVKKKDFSGDSGIVPLGDLTELNGKFYGLTEGGGAYDKGVIFSYEPATGIYSKEIDFNESEKFTPYGSLTELNGSLYGTTYPFTENQSFLYEFDPAFQTYQFKRLFNEIGNGELPGKSMRVLQGKFYGVAHNLSETDDGILFEYDPVTHFYEIRHNFNGMDGRLPLDNLLVYNGKIYGETKGGGIWNAGVLFEYNPTDDEYVVEKVFQGNDGNLPTGGLIEFNGKFFGMTAHGGAYSNGIIYSYNPSSGEFDKLKDFQNNEEEGSIPHHNLVEINGKLYGKTSNGGTFFYGSLFEFDPASNTCTAQNDSVATSSPFTVLNGKMYYYINWYGWFADVLLEYNPALNTVKRLRNFSNYEDGLYLTGKLTAYADKLYGTTILGGAYGRGVIFEYNPATEDYAVIHHFNCETGCQPMGYLTLSDPVTSTKNRWKDANEITIFPNPASDHLTIVNQSVSDGCLMLIQADGRVVKTLRLQGQSQEEVNLGDVPPGLLLWKWVSRREGVALVGKVLVVR